MKSSFATAYLALILTFSNLVSARLSSIASRQLTKSCSFDSEVICSDDEDCQFCNGGKNDGTYCGDDGTICNKGRGCMRQGTCVESGGDNPTGGGGVCSDGSACSSSSTCPKTCNKGSLMGQTCTSDDACGGKGAKCKSGECLPDLCDPNPCGSDATCTTNGSTYTCNCPGGSYFTGETCRDDPCEPNPCIDDAGDAVGTCKISHSVYECTCPDSRTTITDCKTSGHSNLDHSGKCIDLPEGVCAACQGDCDTDDDCGDGLACFVRDSNSPSQDDPVPGCLDNPSSLYAKDFCVYESIWQCGDVEYLVVDGMERDCSWVLASEKCDTYSSYCKQTCDYCRPKTGAATRSSAVDAAGYTWDD